VEELLASNKNGRKKQAQMKTQAIMDENQKKRFIFDNAKKKEFSKQKNCFRRYLI
jgi:hypothetical protein